jgi:hypothetical protein
VHHLPDAPILRRGPLCSCLWQSFVDCISVQVCKSNKHDIRNVDLIDTPGLVDGNVNYAFDVNGIIAELATQVDLILVFLDPMYVGLVASPSPSCDWQALCL